MDALVNPRVAPRAELELLIARRIFAPAAAPAAPQERNGLVLGDHADVGVERQATRGRPAAQDAPLILKERDEDLLGQVGHDLTQLLALA